MAELEPVNKNVIFSWLYQYSPSFFALLLR